MQFDTSAFLPADIDREQAFAPEFADYCQNRPTSVIGLM